MIAIHHENQEFKMTNYGEMKMGCPQLCMDRIENATPHLHKFGSQVISSGICFNYWRTLICQYLQWYFSINISTVYFADVLWQFRGIFTCAHSVMSAGVVSLKKSKQHFSR